MPNGDKTGPNGQGPMTGRGMGFCSGQDRPGRDNPGVNPRAGGGGGRGMGGGMGRGNRGGQRGGGQLGRGGRGLGPVAECTCPACGETIAHQPGVPCSQTTCPKCGAAMTRKR